MTEGHENDFLVTVRAQVMTRDESTEGWLPLAGGGLANVSIRKRRKLPAGVSGHEYIIYGQRISDQRIILSCIINHELKYYKVMPTFHHWRAGKQRNGLTFQTAADARAFDKGILKAYNDLIDGITKSSPSTIYPPLNKYNSVGEDDVFMTLDLPFETENVHKSHSSAETKESNQGIKPDKYVYKYIFLLLIYVCAVNEKGRKEQSANETDALKIHYISNEKACIQSGCSAPRKVIGNITSTSPQTTLPCLNAESTIAASENYSYVTLTAVHDYNYPMVDHPPAAQMLYPRPESTKDLKKRNALETARVSQSPSAPAVIIKESTIGVIKEKDQQKLHHLSRCRYCNELYNDEWNRRGACEYAPDCFRSGFEFISGLSCARCMLYHFMKDSEGETSHPCDCASESGCTKRWFGLTLLSCVMPCLLCYPPLRVCHLIGISCGLCGGKHKPHV
uniref:WH1 domain-containing protein n=1 Tax=Glossina pallidipes TaxID=7398 RepID=A0A1A9Z7N5_GLOPL